jgi:hypothetical protein
MPDLVDRSKRKKEAYQRDVEQKCNKYAKNQSDLSPDEQKKVADGCRVDGLAAYERREQGCVIDTTPKHILKGWRYDRCLERSKTQEPFDPERSVHQKANELRVEKQLTKVLDQLEEDQRLLNFKTFVAEGLPESMQRELLPPNVRPASLEAALRPTPRPTAPESTAPHRPLILDATPAPFPEEDTELTAEAEEAELEEDEEEAVASLRFTTAQDATAPPLALLRTYKAGLRVPASLLTQFTPLVRKRQVLQFLVRRQLQRFSKSQQLRLAPLKGAYADPAVQAFEEFKVLNTLARAPPSLLADYQALINSYGVYSLRPLQDELVRVKVALAGYKTKKPQLGAVRFEKSDVPQFQDPANPAPTEISLHDYQYLANQSLKRLCAHLNQFATEYISQIPIDRADLIARAAAANPDLNIRHLRSHPYKAASIVLGKGANLDQMALEPMLGMLEVYTTMQEKVETVQALLFPPATVRANPDFTDVPPVLLLYYSIPSHFLAYLATTWNVERQWVRNTLVGWRRKLDPALPKQFQIEAVRDLMTQLADYCARYARTKELQRVLQFLQRRHVLHLLQDPTVDLRPLCPPTLQAAYAQFQQVVPPFPAALIAAIRAQITGLTPAQLQAGAVQWQAQLEAAWQRLPPGSPRARNLQTLRNKVTRVIPLLARFPAWFAAFLPGNRYTRAMERMFLTLNELKTARVTRLFTVLRGIIAFTFAQGNPGATGHLQRVLTPQRCVTLPYTSVKRKKRFLPAHLIFNKWVIARQASPELKQQNAKGEWVPVYLTNAEATHRFQAGQPIWLGIPIYAPAQLVGNYLQGSRKGRFWFQLSPSAKIRECIQRGATIQTIRLNVPKGPTGKIVADIILKATDPSAFQHRGQFIRSWDTQYATVPIPPGRYLGSDLNPLGAHALALATEVQEINLKAGSNMLLDFIRASQRLEKYRQWEIPHLQRNVASGSGSLKKQGRQKAQITLLHQRRARMMQELKQHRIPMLYLYGLHRTGAQYGAWDAIQGISPQGQGKTLAMAVTYMPKARGLLALVQAWAADLQAQGWLPQLKAIRLVPLSSSAICATCVAQGRGMRKTRAAGCPYHEFYCTECGTRGDRHANSARVAALLLQRMIENRPLPLSTD